MATAPRDRILDKLDAYLARQDFASAERHLTFWLREAELTGDRATEMLVRSELVGLYRKLDRREEGLSAVRATLDRVEVLGLADTVGGATAYLNCATAEKAFGDPEASLPLFLRAREIYERELAADDPRLGGLYNNMALTLVDLKSFDEAYILYDKAVSVMESTENGMREVAIT
ncbi:MAG: tetratricopeptide repeat protein, partial [Clostridia bacterium]|nr:tetratricopeptide repeat protein [Clostridia bacterium]